VKAWLARFLVAAACASVVSVASADGIARGVAALARAGVAPAAGGVPRLVLATPDPAIAGPAQVGSAWDAGAWGAYGRGVAAAARAAGANVVAVRLGPFASDPQLESFAIEPIAAGITRAHALAALVPSAEPGTDPVALHALDLPPLEAGLRGGAGAIACTLPGAPWVAALCRDPRGLAKALERDVRFEGFVTGSSLRELTTWARVKRAVRKAGLYGRTPLPAAPGARAELSRRLVQSGAVLLKNDGDVLPLDPATTRSLLLVGADEAARAAVAAAFPSARIDVQSDWAGAIAVAGRYQAVVIVTAAAGSDEAAGVAAIFAANPRTIAVVERSPAALEGPAAAAALLLAWDPVAGTAPAVANLLAGKAAPAGRLSVATASYPLGAGLTYTDFVFSGFEVTYGKGRAPVTVSFLVRNAGKRTGTAVPRLTLDLPSGGSRLAAFARITLAPGKERRIRLPLQARAFAVWSASFGAWYVAAGTYPATVADGPAGTPLEGTIRIVSR